MAGAIDSGVAFGAERSTTLPLRSTRNVVKFHLMAFVPSRPGAFSYRRTKSGCASGPLTSILACIGKVTP